jgi:hypothetical protein
VFGEIKDVNRHIMYLCYVDPLAPCGCVCMPLRERFSLISL